MSPELLAAVLNTSDRASYRALCDTMRLPRHVLLQLLWISRHGLRLHHAFRLLSRLSLARARGADGSTTQGRAAGFPLWPGRALRRLPLATASHSLPDLGTLSTELAAMENVLINLVVRSSEGFQAHRFLM